MFHCDSDRSFTFPFLFAEEFAIYLNYVRKLGFEETPDYDFLRELFTKALKNTGEVEDGIYDWMMLNGGKGWEASSVSHSRFARPEMESSADLIVSSSPFPKVCFQLVGSGIERWQRRSPAPQSDRP